MTGSKVWKYRIKTTKTLKRSFLPFVRVECEFNAFKSKSFLLKEFLHFNFNLNQKKFYDLISTVSDKC